jgi:hypothetical protein
MTGWIILGCFVFLAISYTAVFFAGIKKGRKVAEAEINEDLRRKAQSEIEFEKTKDEIRWEVFGNAEAKKAALSGGDSAERFKRANDFLRGKPAS